MSPFSVLCGWAVAATFSVLFSVSIHLKVFMPAFFFYIPILNWGDSGI